MDIAEAYSLISRAIDSGHPAHGYLIIGGVRENAYELALRVLEKLFPDTPEQVRNLTHPDIFVVEPDGKKRIIPVDAMREKIVSPMSLAAYSGGWKAGVIVGADRMEAPSANAFLKSLEEPPPNTLYLLLTDRPDAILSTIVSRCQRINLPLPSGLLEGEDYAEVERFFRTKNVAGLVEKFSALKDAAEDADVQLVRKTFYRTLMSFARETLLVGSVPRYLAFRNVEAVERAFRQSEKSLSDDAVLSFMLEQIVF